MNCKDFLGVCVAGELRAYITQQCYPQKPTDRTKSFGRDPKLLLKVLMFPCDSVTQTIRVFSAGWHLVAASLNKHAADKSLLPSQITTIGWASVLAGITQETTSWLSNSTGLPPENAASDSAGLKWGLRFLHCLPHDRWCCWSLDCIFSSKGLNSWAHD